eukprot:TRINITY_DN15951_c0_g1_i1.p1 TRINITY_DN15951_c0_g1~~TRINITY_DN15951_c0_g1_i1.p1  ORF type:complete len:115 (+),score=24.67 TRINITY_DN15951_c0_g1_i1:205-549(+)
MTMTTLLPAWLLLLVLLSSPAAPLSCYSCYDCITYEVASQLKECKPEEKLCIKIEKLTGGVDRLCATEQQCNAGTPERNATCCSQDGCNSANQVYQRLQLILVGALATFTFLRD